MQVVRIDGKKIKGFRLSRDLGVDDLAHALRRRGFKTNAATISKWERGVVTPHANVLPELARALGIELDDLYSESPTDGADDSEDGRAMRLRKLRAELILNGRDDLAADLASLTRLVQ